MRSGLSDFLFLILLCVCALILMTVLNDVCAKEPCVSECTYTGDVTVWRAECYTVARCVDRQEDGYGSCFDASEYFKLESITCLDIIGDTLEINGEEVWRQNGERYGL